MYKRQVLASCGASDAENLEEYIAKGGYTAFEKALFDMDGAAICREISDSGLRGRGGGGFPAGSKWESVRRHPEEPVKYIVCNEMCIRDSQMGWVFVDSRAEALDGVESGDYYAALIVPEE